MQMNFNRLNNIVGWIVGLIACTVYILTMEPTGSLWDTGEFISSAFKLQVPHPPGAPMYILLGRFFIVLFGDNPQSAARAVNFMNAIASGLTILFLFWTITHFARKLVQKGREELTGSQLFITMASGVVGALAYTFSDSFWYSAVEGEVYALSSLFTAIVFWAILKWEHEVDMESKTDGHKFSHADRWLVFIFYIMGISIGVHLLNLLTIPAIVMVYYFKRYQVTKWGMVWAFLLGCVITGIVQVAIIQWSIKGAGAFDIFFVNEVGTPFFVGFGIYFAILAALLVIGLRFTPEQINKFKGFAIWLGAIILLFCFPFINSGGTFFLLMLAIAAVIAICYYGKSKISSFLKIAIWSTIFVIIGYSTYFTTLIRSNANPSVDMYNVDNPVSLVGYLSREQYGDWPILYGPYFTEEITNEDYVESGDVYVKGKDKYEPAGKQRKLNYGGMETAHLFPRTWDNGTERNQEGVYRNFGGLEQGEQPNTATDIRYFMSYQFRWMYWRYFMWNFTGKQNDLQGFGNIRDGNWQSGIGFIDNKIFGISTDDQLPDTAGKTNKANNKMFFLPFLLGVAGFVHQYLRTRRDFIVNFLLFFFTGFAIVIYLNQAGQQPRERDYAYVGSFYAFAVWIGLGVIWLRDQLAKLMKGNTAVPGYLAFGITLLAVPVLMASQEWDDHDRSQKTLARDLGFDYLESCQKNAILLTFGDNDTYPLWYGQEVEGKRPDLRVINYSLLGTDWYINQLRYKLNESAPADVIFTEEQIQGENRNVVPVYPLPGYDQTKYSDLYTVLKDVVASDDPARKVAMQSGDMANVFPTKKVSIPVDIEEAKKTLTLNPGDTIVSEVKLDINKNYLQKNDLALLAVLASNKWRRPIYVTSTAELRNLGLEKYARMEGLTYRIVPIENSQLEVDLTYKNVMEKFAYGNAKLKGTYFDEENRRHINSIRQTHAMLAKFLAYNGRKDSAMKVLNKYDQGVLEENVPYGMTSNRGNFHNDITKEFLEAAYLAGDTKLVNKVKASLKKDLEQQMKYYRSLGENNMSNDQLAMQAAQILNNKPGDLSAKQQPFVYDIYTSYQMLREIEAMEQQFATPRPGVKLETSPVDLPNPKDTEEGKGPRQ
jgi:transmembrane protein TMEM260 (protein O-mannosyltransferase)